MHRDIKPANILLNEGRALISDFNLGRIMKPEDVEKTVVGTPLYMAP